MNKVQIFIVPSDSTDNVRLGNFKLVIDPSSLDDLDLYVLKNFTKYVDFNKDGSGVAERWNTAMFAGLKEIAHWLGHELVYVENPAEDVVKVARHAVYVRDTFGWIDMRQGDPSYPQKRGDFIE